MKRSWITATFRVLLILSITLDNSCCLDEPHCDATASRVVLNVRRTNATSVTEPHDDYHWLDVSLDHLGYLKINWTMAGTMHEESDVKLCFNAKSNRDLKTLLKRCFIVNIPRMGGSAQVFCRFQIEHVGQIPDIEAVVTFLTQGQLRYYYGDFKVALEDSRCCIDGTDSPHCDVTSSRMKHVRRIKASSVTEPHDDYQWLDVCVSLGYLKINWTMPQTISDGSDIKLCYDAKSNRDLNTIFKQCFIVKIPRMDRSAQMFCWFKMEHIREKPYIETVVTFPTQGQPRYYYGDFNAALVENCTDVCAVPVVSFRTLFFRCDSTNLIWHDEDVSLEQLSFTATKSTLCQNIPLNFSKTAEGKVEFTVNCAYNGLGRIYFLYTIRENYCRSYVNVRVSCETGTSMSTHTRPPDRANKSLTITALVPIAAVLVISVITLIIFVIRRRNSKDRHIQAPRNDRQHRRVYAPIGLNARLGDIEENNRLTTEYT